MLNDWEHMSKFDLKSNEGAFLSYSLNSRAYRVINKGSKTVMESANIVVDDQGTVSTGPRLDEREIEGSLHRSRGNASTNNETPGNSSSLDCGPAFFNVCPHSNGRDSFFYFLNLFFLFF